MHTHTHTHVYKRIHIRFLLFHPDPMNRVHNSEEAPRSFTMAPSVVVERFEGKQWCSRAPVDEHADVLARERPK